jgi:hypothetical protein
MLSQRALTWFMQSACEATVGELQIARHCIGSTERLLACMPSLAFQESVITLAQSV